MYHIKGTLTEYEQELISKYPDDIQEELKYEIIKSKEYFERGYKEWITYMELGVTINIKPPKTKNGKKVILIGAPPDPRRIEHYKKYPHGTGYIVTYRGV